MKTRVVLPNTTTPWPVNAYDAAVIDDLMGSYVGLSEKIRRTTKVLLRNRLASLQIPDYSSNRSMDRWMDVHTNGSNLGQRMVRSADDYRMYSGHLLEGIPGGYGEGADKPNFGGMMSAHRRSLKSILVDRRGRLSGVLDDQGRLIGKDGERMDVESFAIVDDDGRLLRDDGTVLGEDVRHEPGTPVALLSNGERVELTKYGVWIDANKYTRNRLRLPSRERRTLDVAFEFHSARITSHGSHASPSSGTISVSPSAFEADPFGYIAAEHVLHEATHVMIYQYRKWNHPLRSALKDLWLAATFLLSPIHYPITNTVSQILFEENACMGAQWELSSRLSTGVREELADYYMSEMTRWIPERALRGFKSVLHLGRYVKRHPELKDALHDDTGIKAATLKWQWLAWKSTSFGHLPKKRYVKMLATTHRGNIALVPYNFLRSYYVHGKKENSVEHFLIDAIGHPYLVLPKIAAWSGLLYFLLR